MERKYISDEMGNPLVEVTKKVIRENRVLDDGESQERDVVRYSILPLSEISDIFLERIEEVLMRAEQDLSEADPLSKVLENTTEVVIHDEILSKRASLLQRQEAHVIYESNLIEEIPEASEKSLLYQIVTDCPLGHVGAFLSLKNLAEKKSPLTLDHLFSAHALLYDEQEYLGHKIPSKPISTKDSMKILKDLHQYAEENHLSEKETDDLFIQKQKEIESESRLGRRGCLRSEWVRIGNRLVVPPQKDHLKDLLEQMETQIQNLLDSKKTNTKMVLELAGKYHVLFENIHPFIDGNGRLGRLIVQYTLLRFGLTSPLLIPFEKRQEYYHCFQGDAERNMGAFFFELWQKGSFMKES